MIKNLERITSDYQRMWNESKEQLKKGKIDTDPVPDNSSRRWGVSIVIRPTEPALSKLVNTADEIAKFAGSDQIIYDDSNLHTTIRSIEFQRLEVDENDEKVKEYEEALRVVTEKFGSIKISYKGLTASKGGVMAQGWPLDDTLQEIREAFHEELEKRGLLGGPEEVSIRQTSHASLAVFTQPLADPEGLVNYLQDNRETDFGTCEITQIDLVRYRRTETDVSLVVFATLQLMQNA